MNVELFDDPALRHKIGTLISDLQKEQEIFEKEISALREARRGKNESMGFFTPPSIGSRLSWDISLAGLKDTADAAMAAGKKFEMKYRGRLEEARSLLQKRGADPGPLTPQEGSQLFPRFELKQIVIKLDDALKRIGSATGYVGFLDLLGFSRKVSGGLDGTFLRHYQEALSRALDVSENIHYVVSSDSIIIYSTHDHEEGLLQVTLAAARTMSELFAIHIPVRGAISYGPFRESRTFRGTIIAGPPILEAIEYEKRQDWLGVIFTPSVIQKNPQLTTKQTVRAVSGRKDAVWYGKHLIHYYEEIPFHTETGNLESYRGVAVLPNPNPQSAADATGAALRAAAEYVSAMEKFAPDPAAQKKYRATLAFLNRSLKVIGPRLTD